MTIKEYLAAVRKRTGKSLGKSSVTEDDLEEIEDALGESLPPSYKELVTGCHGGKLCDSSQVMIFWPGRDVHENFRLLSQIEGFYGPRFLMPLYEVGDGDVYCFDLRFADDEGESPVVWFKHETHGPRSKKFEPIAANFAEFLVDYISPDSYRAAGH